MSTTEVNWGYNCLTDGVHHGRPEALWNIPLLQSLHMFKVEELQEIVVARIYNDALQFVEHELAPRFTQAWADRVRDLAAEKFSDRVQRKATELSQYYNEPRWRREVQGVIERIQMDKLNAHYQPEHSHDSINQVCRMLGVDCRFQAERELTS